jgi:simple sugar transport system permease protein
VSVLRLISRTKLYWGLMAIFLIGVLGSPVSSKGNNIFLSYGNLLDVLRQVSTTGLIATGMTAVIITGGIDLSVGSLMAICSVVCAMLLTMPGDTPAAAMGLPMAAVVALVIGVSIVRFIFTNIEKARAGADVSRDLTLDAIRGLIIPVAVGAVFAALLLWYLLPQVDTKFGVLGVLIVAPCVGLCFGALNGILIVAGRLQPFIVTLAMMVTALGIARLTAGQNNAVLPVYTGSNAVAEFDALRSLVFGVVPMPGLFFITAIVIYAAVLRFTPFGRYVYAIGGNEEAARLSGIESGKVKIVTYAVSGLLAGVAAVLYVAQYRQGKPDAGAGLELDAIAAVVIGGTSLMGGRGSMAGTFCGVLIFGLLSNILQLHNINSNLQLVLKGLIIIGTVLVQERNAADLLSFLRLPAIRPTQKEAVAEKRPRQETMAHTTGGNANETP